MWRWGSLVLVIFGVACGGEGEAPAVSNITLSRPDARRGSEFFASAHVIDIDGDINGAQIDLTLESTDGVTTLESTTFADDVRQGATEADIIVGLTVFGSIDLGAYELTMVVEDRAGHRSPDVIARLSIDQ